MCVPVFFLFDAALPFWVWFVYCCLNASARRGWLYLHRMSDNQHWSSSELNERDLLRLANKLPHDKWKPLGRVLGLCERDLDNIVANPKYNDPVEQRYQMLLLWQQSRADEATWEKLEEALCSEEVGCPHLARRHQTSNHDLKPGEDICVTNALYVASNEPLHYCSYLNSLACQTPLRKGLIVLHKPICTTGM